MKRLQHEYFAFCFLLASVFLHGGCGAVAIVGTPSSHEKRVPAEYDLTERKDRKILVLVRQAPWLNPPENLRYYLTEAINGHLAGKVRIPSGNILTYRDLSKFRSERADFALLSPAQVGTALGADMVLLVMVEDFNLQKIADTGYYKGSLKAGTAIVSTVTAEKLWPESVGGKGIKVGFEIGPRRREAAFKRLVRACAYCIVRYLYYCPKDKFKIFDDKSDIAWGD